MNEAGTAPGRVFISYSHDSEPHAQAVLMLAQELRRRGIDAWLDRFEPTPAQGWPRWIAEQVQEAKYIVLVCTATYKRRFQGREQPGRGRGVFYEGLLATQLLYKGKLDLSKLVPVVIPGATLDDIPDEVGSGTHHVLPEDLDRLVARLSDRLAVTPLPLKSDPDTATGMPDEPNEADQLAALYVELDRRGSVGDDVEDLRKEILALRRRLREGKSLQSGDYLDDRYRLLEIAGKGGFGEVWKAWDRQESHFVAVKVLHQQWSKDSDKLERFVRGARKMASLRHPGIVSVLRGHVADENYHFFVMRWMQGGDLFRAIKDNRVTRDAGLRALAQVAEALVYVHTSEMIHRDVKPHNVLLDGHGNAALTDFDLVQAYDTTHGTRTAGMGTFWYAAPELQIDASRVDRRVDVYGLGMTTLYCLLGRDPPALVARTEPEVLRNLPCSPALVRAIAHAVAYDRNQRARDCSELERVLRAIEPQLQSVVNDRAFISTPPPRPQRTTNKLLRMGMIGTVLGVSIWVAVLPYSPASESGPRSAKSKSDDKPVAMLPLSADEPDEPAQITVNAIEQALTAGSRDDALRLLKPARHEFPNDPTLLWYEGKALAMSNSASSKATALERYGQAAKVNPRLLDNPDFYLELQDLLRNPELRAQAIALVVEKLGRPGHAFLLELVNVDDPSKILSWEDRHRVLVELNEDEESSKLVDTKVNLARDLYQAAKSPKPCSNFRDAVDAIGVTRDAYFIEHVGNPKLKLPLPNPEDKDDAAVCSELQVRLDAAREAVFEANPTEAAAFQAPLKTSRRRRSE